MAATDHPLKRLVSLFIDDFAAWLLNCPVRATQPLNMEVAAVLPPSDQVFRVTLADGRDLVLHIEFRGRRSHPPIPWRMLEYMPRLAVTYRLPLWSVVLYVGTGAGIDDTGHHAIQGPAAVAPLVWRYQVVHLWQMKAEDVLALNQPALFSAGRTSAPRPTSGGAPCRGCTAAPGPPKLNRAGVS